MFCDYCNCDDCKYGADLISHAQTSDGDWICDVCYHYDVCPGHPCDNKDCEHRPDLVSGWMPKKKKIGEDND
jgi:hypothetical protein